MTITRHGIHCHFFDGADFSTRFDDEMLDKLKRDVVRLHESGRGHSDVDVLFTVISMKNRSVAGLTMNEILSGIELLRNLIVTNEEINIVSLENEIRVTKVAVLALKAVIFVDIDVFVAGMRRMKEKGRIFI